MKARPPGDSIAERYRLVGVLGRSGTCVTYEAEELAGRRERVVIKELALLGMRDWKALELFEREAATLASLEHAAIPRYRECFHLEQDGDTHFYTVQDLAPGQTLDALVQNGWQPTEEQVRNIALQLLDVLAYLHDREPVVIHRDIKPQNVLWAPDGRVFLVDFGAVQNTITTTLSPGTTIVGTLGYMAPEQLRGHALPASDLYGLGCTLLFLLARKPPGALPQKRLQVSFREHVQLSEAFAAWLDRMIAAAVEDRYVTARDALIDLWRGRRTRRRRTRVLAWSAVGALALGLALSLGGGLLIRRQAQDVDGARILSGWGGGGARKARCKPLAPLRAPSRGPMSLPALAIPPPGDIDEAALLAQLDRDYAELARREPILFATGPAPPDLMQRATRPNWDAELDHIAMRRPRAAIPYLIKALHAPAETRRWKLFYDEEMTTRLLVILTGVRVPEASPGMSRAQRLHQLVHGWWLPIERAGLSTSLHEMSDEQLEIVAAALLEPDARPFYDHHVPRLWQQPRTQVFSVPAMVPAIFDAVAHGGSRSSARGMLGYIHRDYAIAPLAAVAHGTSCSRADRVLALSVLQSAGEEVDAELLAMYERERNVALRAELLVNMGSSQRLEVMLPALIAGIHDSNVDIQHAAMEAFRTQRALGRLPAMSDEILTRIEPLLLSASGEQRWIRSVALAGMLCSSRVAPMLVQMVRKMLRERQPTYLLYPMQALETLTGHEGSCGSVYNIETIYSETYHDEAFWTAAAEQFLHRWDHEREQKSARARSTPVTYENSIDRNLE